HVLDMFEPQDHPHDFQYPGGPPIPPYDNAGYTLAFQMGIAFDRILEGFSGPFERLRDLAAPPPGTVTDPPPGGGYLLDRRVNDAVIVVNRLLKAGQEVSWVTDGDPPGAFFVAASPGARAILDRSARELGVSAKGAARPAGALVRLRAPRIGLWDQYGGSMPSGWTRWLLEQFEFPFEVVYPPALDRDDLSARFDVLVFVDGAIPASGAAGERGQREPDPERIPAEYRDRLGRVTVEKTVPRLRTFLEQGGTILAIGSSTSLARHLGLPLDDALVERLPDGTTRRLPGEKFYIPGSVLRVAVDPRHPVAHGMPAEADVFFDQSPAFRLAPDAHLKGVTPVAWFDRAAPLRSGWAWGQHYLEGAVAVAEARVGRGRLLLYGPEILFRGQPHGTFKFFFNGLYLGGTGAATRQTETGSVD
ncbi:MAG TPA: hypothetical protein VNI83_06725, partial [Vicinamibacterales bacterium]|nr:hypothetical protein [Vicinamibacterales bacterium]